MNYKNPKNLDALKKVLKNLTVFCAVIFTSAIIFYSPNISSQTSALPDCAALLEIPIQIQPQPGKNCLFFGKKLCNDIPSAPYPIDRSSIIQAPEAIKHRDNCYDLSDLPLCSQIDDGHLVLPKKNCVQECSDVAFVNPNPTASPPLVRGIDYAVHNRDCIRFADNDPAETGLQTTAQADAEPSPSRKFYINDPNKPDLNSTSRKCHQLPTAKLPNTTSSNKNCELTKCNLLSTDELNESRISKGEQIYCDGDVKCYNFSKAQLPFTRFRVTNSMCKIHDCKPTSSSAVCGEDDTKNITDKDVIYPGYLDDYKKYINAGLDITNAYLCNPVICKPTILLQYRCKPYAATNPTERNDGENGVGGCDETGNGSVCANGYCYKTIDCNLAKNNNAPECVSSSTSDSGAVGTNDDKGLDSWFYRPIPLPKALDANGLISSKKINIDLSADYTTVEGRAARFCYTQERMDKDVENVNDYGWHDTLDLGPFGIMNFGFFHSYLRPDQSRSPGICRSSLTSAGSRLNDRGNGYIYLCGNNGNLYSKVSNHTAYHKGYTYTEFKEGDAKHTITVCLRFKNLGFPQDISWPNKQSETCGERECGISCGFGLCRLSACGKDMCFNLSVSDIHPKDCMMSDNNFDGSAESDCQVILDTFLRLRAVKYGNNICTFLDLKGTLAYDDQYFKGQEKLANGTTCISGVANDSGFCDGAKNTNDRPGLASKWRTVLQIPYILNNRPAGQAQGYLNSEGRLFPAQECMRTPLRVSPPFTPNLATADNASKLFIPPVYVVRTMTIKNSGIGSTSLNPAEPMGATDFHYPEIEVRFGTDTKYLSLGMGKTGIETTDADPNGSATMTTKVVGKDYSVEVFVKKQFKTTTNDPIFCLYKKVKDSTGKPLDPTRVQCVDRTLPEIDSSKAIIGLKRKAVVYPDPSNTYRSSKIVLRYLADLGANKIDNSCAIGSDDVCSTEIKITNADSAVETCDSSIDAYQICAKRDPCTKLNIECIKNELDMHLAKIAGQPLDSFLTVRNNCNKNLLSSCNSLKGITTASNATVTTMGESSEWPAANNLRYGWFNELCITKGFERKLKRIIAYKLPDGSRGKCRVDAPKLGADCRAGGKAPDCPCVIAPDEDSAGVEEVVSTETPHEAGLCIDMPMPKTCPPIDYNPNQNPDSADSEYVASSLGQASYSSGYSSDKSDITDFVHRSHKFRTEGSVSSPAIPLRGHAEFPLGILGMNEIEGECKGFWRAQRSSTGFISKPKISCLDVAGDAQWDTSANVASPCVRNSCPEISTTGPDRNGNFQGNYDSGEADKEKRGLSHGFALWNSVTSSDFPITSTSDRCITGYKLKNAATKTASGIVSGTAAAAASRNNQITGYSSASEGATRVSRVCNQLGQWQTTTNSCERIKCPPIDPPVPTSDNRAAWIEWNSSHSAGARFGIATDDKGEYMAVAEVRDPTTNAIITPACNTTPCYTDTLASKNLPSVPPFFPPESIAIGKCVERLGFFQSPGASPPTRKCDNLGNWLRVENPCVTACQKIDEPPSSDPYSAANSNANGFSTWAGVEDLDAGVSAVVTGACTTKTDRDGKPYFKYPYPPLRDDGGIPYALSQTLDLANHKIPFDVTIDTIRPATTPKRTCTDYFGNGEIKAHRWSAPSSSCISKCPGSDIDPRIGVGRTLHNKKASVAMNVNFEIAINDGGDKLNLGTYAVPAGKIFIDWASTGFGEWAYVTQMGGGAGGISSQSVRDYEANRANGKFILARKCNETTHKWEAPIVLCATNSDNNNGNTITSSNAVFPTFPANAVSNPPNTTSNVSEGDIVTGTCKTNFYPLDKDSTKLPKYQCSAKDATRNIDEFFFSLTSGKACTKYCSTIDSTFTSKLGAAHGYFSSVQQDTVLPGAKIFLNCANSNYGHEIGSAPLGTGQNTGVLHDCGRSPTERINIAPSITCNTVSGTWDNVTNPCSACRKCSFDEGAPDIIGTTSMQGTGYAACAYFNFVKGWNKQYCLGTSIESSETVTCSATATCPYDPGFFYEMQYLNVTGSCRFQCLDGAFVVIGTGMSYQWQ